ncbi:hypothetical protein ONZ45_g7104 [Pleurotus djamor]|nr:hypothetical protein ONZ45_g7104 [Pleurotus djamor]
MSSSTNLRLAVCLFPGVTCLDYQGPIELLGFLFPENQAIMKEHFPDLSFPVSIDATYLSHTLDKVKPMAGPTLVPDRTYESVKDEEQFDLILIPGGPGASPGSYSVTLLDFLKRQEPKVKHILTVCTGSWILAEAGLLKGKKATTNKAFYKQVEASTRGSGVEWVPKARFVINDDKKIWTSSGVTAGMDMASAFLDHIVGTKTGDFARSGIELTAKGAGEDEFAAVTLPRGNVERTKSKSGVPPETLAKIARMEGAHQNGYENFPLWIAAVLTANFAGIDNYTLNVASLAYFTLRILYNHIYINHNTFGGGWLRTLVYFTALPIPLWLLVKSANKVASSV